MAYSKIEKYDEQVTEGLVVNYREALSLLGEDPTREGLLKTPERVAKAMQYLTQGYQLDAAAILNSAKFHEDVSEMIIVKDIELYSMCEHHMLPFSGVAHIGYIPNQNGRITGSSRSGSGCRDGGHHCHLAVEGRSDRGAEARRIRGLQRALAGAHPDP